MKDSENPVYRTIHDAIHSGKSEVVIDGKSYPVKENPNNGCKFVIYDGISFMEQNKHKSSKYAQAARDGKKITWGIKSGGWILLQD